MNENKKAKITLPERPEDKGYRFARLGKYVSNLVPSWRPFNVDNKIPQETINELLETPDAFVEPNPDESETPKTETVIHQYGASVSWLSFNHTEVQVDLLKHREEFQGRTFRLVNRNWPFRHTHDLVDWLNNAFQPPKVDGSLLHPKTLLAPLKFKNFPAVRDTSTSSIPYYNPMLPKIDPDGPPHIALLVMGGNDMLEHLDAVKAYVNQWEATDDVATMSPKSFADGVVERMCTLLDAMQEAGFKRVGVIPLNREHVKDIIRSLDIPEVMVDALEDAYQRIAEKYPDFVYLSSHDLYEGLNPDTDYLDSPIKQDFLRNRYYLEKPADLIMRREVYSLEASVYKATLENDIEHGRERVHPNPLGQAKVAKTMAETVAELELGARSPCLNKPFKGFSREPDTNITHSAESGVVTDIQEFRAIG